MAGDLFDALEMDEILAQLLRGDQFWSTLEILSQLTHTGQIGLVGTGTDRHELQIFGEGF